MSKQYPAPPAMSIDVNKKYTATFDTTRGKIVCELFAKDAPKTVNNFVFLANEKFYDGTVFHRVINGFMVQGGGFTKDMRQKPVQAWLSGNDLNIAILDQNEKEITTWRKS